MPLSAVLRMRKLMGKVKRAPGKFVDNLEAKEKAISAAKKERDMAAIKANLRQ